MAPVRVMAGPRPSVLREGVVAGLIGAAVVALWFLVFDVARGRPLLTPTVLGAVVFQGVTRPTDVELGAGLILGYTVLHGLAFVAFGVVAATLLDVSEREPPLFMAVVILFAAFEAFFFAVANALGAWVLGVLVWWAVLVANLLASIAMLWYFFRRHRRLPGTLVGQWAGVLREGVIAGVLGAAVVALWFLAIDAIQGEPLRTPKLLGLGLLGQPDPVLAVVLYTLVHGAAFVAFGLLGAVLISGAERQPMLVFGLVILFAAFEVFFFAAVVVGARWLLDELVAWTILAANVLAAAAMLAYFFKGHRTLLRRTDEAWAQEEE